jgi:hypothetical protein
MGLHPMGVPSRSICPCSIGFDNLADARYRLHVLISHCHCPTGAPAISLSAGNQTRYVVSPDRRVVTESLPAANHFVSGGPLWVIRAYGDLNDVNSRAATMLLRVACPPVHR